MPFRLFPSSDDDDFLVPCCCGCTSDDDPESSNDDMDILLLLDSDIYNGCKVFFSFTVCVCVCGNYLVKGEYLCIKKRKISTGGLLLLSNFPNAVHKLISFFFFLCVYFFVGR